MNTYLHSMGFLIHLLLLIQIRNHEQKSYQIRNVNHKECTQSPCCMHHKQFLVTVEGEEGFMPGLSPKTSLCKSPAAVFDQCESTCVFSSLVSLMPHTSQNKRVSDQHEYTSASSSNYPQ